MRRTAIAHCPACSVSFLCPSLFLRHLFGIPRALPVSHAHCARQIRARMREPSVMATNPFQSRDQIQNRVWPILEKLARRAWDRDGLTQEQKKPVNGAAGTLYSKILSVTSDLPAQSPAAQTPPRGIDVDDNQWRQFAENELVGHERETVCAQQHSYIAVSAVENWPSRNAVRLSSSSVRIRVSRWSLGTSLRTSKTLIVRNHSPKITPNGGLECNTMIGARGRAYWT